MLSHTLDSLHNKKFYIFASTLLLYFIFCLTVNAMFYSGDNFRYAFGGYTQACSKDDGFYFMLTLGRPIQAYLDCFTFKYAYTLEHMKIVRLLSVVIMGIGMGLLVDIFCQLGFGLFVAFFGAGWFFLIPHLYGDSIIIGQVCLPFALLFVILAWKMFNLSRTKTAFLFLLASLLTYPAISFFFPVLIMLQVLKSNLSDWFKIRREILQKIIFFCITCSIYFVWAYYNMHYHAQAPVPAQYHVDHPNFNVAEIGKRLAIMLNLFNQHWGFAINREIVFQAWFMILCLGSGFLIAAINLFKSSIFKNDKNHALNLLTQKAIIVITLYFLCNTFFLIIPKLDLGSRILYGAVSLGLACLLWAIFQISSLFPKQYKNIFTGSLITLVFLYLGSNASLYTSNKTTEFVNVLTATQIELNQSISKDNQLRRIHYIIPESVYPYEKFFLTSGALFNLFGQKKYALKWCSLPRGIPGKEQDHQAEVIACLNSLPKNGIGITYSRPNEMFAQTEHMVVLNTKL